MSFRQKKQELLAWRTWLGQNQDELAACGIPQSVFENRDHWYYFLDHGCFTPLGSASPSIAVDLLDKAAAQRLCLFLEKDNLCPNSASLNRLQFILKRGHHSGEAI